MCWLFEDAARRDAQLSRWMAFCLEMGLTRGHVYATREHDAVAIWSPPDVTLFDALWGPRMAELMTDLLGKKKARRRMAEMAAPLSHGKSDEPHFYLFMLGADPARQGRGLGSALLSPMLERCDAQGLAIQLESSNPRNVPFYRRHGFEVTAEVKLGEDGPCVQPMRRIAGASGA